MNPYSDKWYHLITLLTLISVFALFAIVSRCSRSLRYRIWINRLVFHIFSGFFGILAIALCIIVLVVPMNSEDATKSTADVISVIVFFFILSVGLCFVQRVRICPECGRKSLHFTSNIITGYSKICLTCGFLKSAGETISSKGTNAREGDNSIS